MDDLRQEVEFYRLQLPEFNEKPTKPEKKVVTKNNDDTFPLPIPVIRITEPETSPNKSVLETTISSMQAESVKLISHYNDIKAKLMEAEEVLYVNTVK
jgi:hypothetical protein